MELYEDDCILSMMDEKPCIGKQGKSCDRLMVLQYVSFSQPVVLCQYNYMFILKSSFINIVFEKATKSFLECAKAFPKCQRRLT